MLLFGVLFGLHCAVIGAFFWWKGVKTMEERAASRAACTPSACFVGDADGHSLCAPLQRNGRKLKLCPRIKVAHTERCDISSWDTSSVCPALQQRASIWVSADVLCREGSTHPTWAGRPLLEGNLGCSLSQRCSNTLQPDFCRVNEDGNVHCISLLCVSAPCWCLILYMTVLAGMVPNSNEIWVHYFLSDVKCLFRIPVNGVRK